MRYIIFSLLMLTVLGSCGRKQTVVRQYENPVCPQNLPDPSLLRGDDGRFYLFATENGGGLPVMRSADLMEWEWVADAFTSEGRPDFVDGGGIWAPDINKIGEKYVLYYSMSTWGGEDEAGVGVAWSDKPEGPFTDMGKLVDMKNSGVRNSIDPFYIEDFGRHFLFWGSFNGIFAVELEKDGLSLKKDARIFKIADTAYEATYIHKKDGYYYLFASVGTCCEGVNSTYTTVVGRSELLLGPYADKQEGLMLNNRHEVLIRANERFAGPGHNSEIVTDDNGDDWILYHAFDRENPEGRRLMLDRVDWVDGWPVIGDGTPSVTSTGPVFKRR